MSVERIMKVNLVTNEADLWIPIQSLKDHLNNLEPEELKGAKIPSIRIENTTLKSKLITNSPRPESYVRFYDQLTHTLKKANADSADAAYAYIELYGKWDTYDFLRRYHGKYNNIADLSEEMHSDVASRIPKRMLKAINWENVWSAVEDTQFRTAPTRGGIHAFRTLDGSKFKR